ncbi:MAG: DNA replication and repair protein RecF [Bacilli bacterium]|nr:DNA replication and repair protein RecF [Bacilli bacterium]
MLISNLELLDFRNYPKLQAIFTSGLNVIIGNNGIGKTNVVEAIDLFGFAKSFRTNDTKNLIRQGQQKAIINATIHIPSRIEIQIELKERSKRVLVNGKTLPKLSHLSRYVSCTTFQPEDVLFFDDSPQKRRRFIDTNIVRQDEIYLGALTRYEKFLKERNAALKREANEELLNLIDPSFLKEAALIVEKREKYIHDLARVVNKILKELTKEYLNLKLQYSSSLGSKENILQNGIEILTKERRRELALESTTLGPHRDDLMAILNGRNAKEHASQGQKRLIAIALTLAPYFMEKEDHKKPIIILDDVLSELDLNHQERLINLLLKCNQVFITATHYDNHAHAIYEITDTKEIRRIN